MWDLATIIWMNERAVREPVAVSQNSQNRQNRGSEPKIANPPGQPVSDRKSAG